MLSRRALVSGAVALAAARFLAGRQGAVAATPLLTVDPFSLGVASGDPRADGFVLWTRITGVGRDVAVGYEIATDQNFRQIVRKGKVRAPVALGGSAHLDVGGLLPGQPYFYRFHLAGAVSRTGRVATVALKPSRARFALTSCQHWEQGWFGAYRDMLANDVDAILQVGDYIYEKSFGVGPDIRSFGAPEPETLDDYRARYALYRSDPDLADAHAAVPFIVTWDDHEVENDYAGTQGVETADAAAFVARRAAAYQAYFEHMPIASERLLADRGVRLYRRLGWGDLATLHVLDTRQYRTSHACMTPAERGGRVTRNCGAATAPEATMMGSAQEDWLRRGLARERARWSLVTQQTLFSRLFLPQGRDAHYSDIWDGYVATRDRTVEAMRQPAVRNAVVLGGDVHSFWLNDVKSDFDDPSSATVASEIVTTCLASHNGPAALFDPAPALNPHVRYLDNAHSGYALIDVTHEAIGIDLRALASLSERNSAIRSLKRANIVDRKAGFAA